MPSCCIFTSFKIMDMHVQKAKLYVKRFRYSFLAFLVVFHIMISTHKTYSVQIMVRDIEGNAKPIKIKNLTQSQCDSVIEAQPDAGFERAKAASSKRIKFYGVIPFWVMNLVYSFYIYYLVVIVIRTIIAIRHPTRQKAEQRQA